MAVVPRNGSADVPLTTQNNQQDNTSWRNTWAITHNWPRGITDPSPYNIANSNNTNGWSVTPDYNNMKATVSAPAWADYYGEYNVFALGSSNTEMGNGAFFIEDTMIAANSSSSGRLTLTSNTPVTTSDASGTTIYFTPYDGNQIALYDGAVWRVRQFAQVALNLSIAAGSIYDVFVYDNLGAVTLELSDPWTNNTSRAQQVQLLDGVYVKSLDSTRRYLGTIRATDTNTTEDSEKKRFVWNYHNRVRRLLRVTESTGSWNYSDGTYRAANNNTGNRVEAVTGQPESLLQLTLWVIVLSYSPHGFAASIGEDSTSTPATGIIGQHWPDPNIDDTTTAKLNAISAYYNAHPLGYHYWQWIERGPSGWTGTVLWYGDDGQASALQSGMTGWIEG